MNDWLLSAELAPDPSGHLAPLYSAAGAGELHLPFCPGCGTPLELEQVVCDRCGTAGVEWRAVEPRGTVHSMTTVHRREPGLVLAEDPYHVVDVELRSGHRLLMTTLEPLEQAPAIGDPVTVGFRSVGDVSVPAARLAGTTHAPNHPGR